MLSPRASREADLVEQFWPAQHPLGARGDAPMKPNLSLQLAMAPAGAFRNFRMSPGGSSTWVHVVSGRKVRTCNILKVSLKAIMPCRYCKQMCQLEATCVVAWYKHFLLPFMWCILVKGVKDDMSGNLVVGHVCHQVFALLPPTVENLAVYVAWAGSAAQQAGLFLAEHAKGAVKIEVPAGATLFIPSRHRLSLP